MRYFYGTLVIAAFEFSGAGVAIGIPFYLNLALGCLGVLFLECFALRVAGDANRKILRALYGKS